MLFVPVQTTADIYFWKDASGKTRYSDKPQIGSQPLKLRDETSWYRVRKVYDGDTVILENGTKIRLLGINTPEIEGRYKQEEPGGEEAKRWLTKFLMGKQVRLHKDVEKKDKYKRTLAHLFTRGGLHINLEMVKRGLATVNIHIPNLQFSEQLIQVQELAELEKLGIWGRQEYLPIPYAQIVRGKDKGWMRLTGRVHKIRRSRRFSYLEFNKNANLRIANDNLSFFPELSEYMNNEIEIRGWPSRSKGQYSVLIRHPSAIKVLD